MARHHHCSIADEIGGVRSDRAELIDKLATLCKERAPAAVIAETNKAIQAATERLNELEAESAARNAKQLAKGGGTPHVLGPNVKFKTSELPPAWHRR